MGPACGEPAGTVQVRADETASVTVSVSRRYGSIQGGVTVEGRTNHAGVRVALVGRSKSVTTSTSGAFQFNRLLPGTYSVQATLATFDTATVPEDVSLDTYGNTKLTPNRSRGGVKGTVPRDDAGAGEHAGTEVTRVGTTLVTTTNPWRSSRGATPASSSAWRTRWCRVPGRCDWRRACPAGPRWPDLGGAGDDAGHRRGSRRGRQAGWKRRAVRQVHAGHAPGLHERRRPQRRRGPLSRNGNQQGWDARCLAKQHLGAGLHAPVEAATLAAAGNAARRHMRDARRTAMSAIVSRRMPEGTKKEPQMKAGRSTR